MYKKLLITLVLILSVSFFAIGCSKKEGPMEKAGKTVDKAVEDAGDKMEKATE